MKIVLKKFGKNIHGIELMIIFVTSLTIKHKPMTNLSNLVAFGTIMIGDTNKSVSIYSNKAFGELNMHNVDLYIDVYGNKVKVKSMLFNNLSELVSAN